MQHLIAWICFLVALIVAVFGSFRSWRPVEGGPGWYGSLNGVALGFLAAGFVVLYWPGA
jgi:hypothetical protein